LTEAMSLVGFPKISTASRLSNIENCYRKDRSSDAFIADVIAEYEKR